MTGVGRDGENAKAKRRDALGCVHDWAVTSTWTTSIGAVGCSMTCKKCGRTVIV